MPVSRKCSTVTVRKQMVTRAGITFDLCSPSQVYLICYQNVLELFHADEVLCCILLKIMFIKCYVYLEL